MLLIICLTASLLPLVAAEFASEAEAQTTKQPAALDLSDLQSSTARTKQNADGSYTTTFHTAPVQFEVSRGQWRTIDPTLGPTTEPGFDLATGPNLFDVFFSDQPVGDFMELRIHEESVRMELEGAQPTEAQADGARLVYPDAVADTDLRYEVTTLGVKETLVLNDPEAQSSYTFNLTTSDPTMEAQPNPDGSYDFIGGDDANPLFVLDAPTVRDSSVTGEVEAYATGEASMEVTPHDGGFEVALSVDPEWLSAPERVFPVLLDPTVTIQEGIESTEDASFDWACMSCAGTTGTRLPIGTNSSNVWRAGLRFDLSAIPEGPMASAAQLKLFYDGTCVGGSSNCGGKSHGLAVKQMNSAWVTSTKPNNMTVGPTVASTTLASGAEPPQWISWDVEELVNDWLLYDVPNNGVLVKRSTEPSGASGPRVPGKRFTGDPTMRPKLEVTWINTASTLHAPEVLHSNGAELRWSRYPFDGVFGFAGYEIHRSRDASFTPGAATFIAHIGDVDRTTYRDTTAAPDQSFTYRIVTWGNSSDRRTVTLPAAGLTTASLQPEPNAGSSTFMVDGDSSCKNYGASTSLRVGTTDNYVYRPLIRFDLRKIPPDANVSSAQLSLYHEATSANIGVDIHRVTRAWREGGANGACSGRGATWQETQRGRNGVRREQTAPAPSWPPLRSTARPWGGTATTSSRW